jgi:uncharacterized protein involved in outer membrane biogenesis
MSAALIIRRSLVWSVAVLAALMLLAAGLAAALDAGYGRGLLTRYVAARIHRPLQVSGALQTHLFSLHPRVVAAHVTIGNPPWMPAGTIAEIGRLSAVFKLPGLDHPGGIIGLDLESTNLNLVRDATGRANWQMTDPGKGRVVKNSPIIRSLLMPGAHVVLADAQRHLDFVGTVSAADPESAASPAPLRLEGSGQLNGRSVAFEVTADALATASHRTPYHFTYTENSSGTRIQGSGVLPQPFAFDILDARFEAVGPDLKDLYFLTGVRLLDTGDYHLTGSISRRITRTVFSDLNVTSAASDMHGTVSIDSASNRRRLDLDLTSKLLRLSDLGARAAGRSTEPNPTLLLSNAMVSPNVLHHDGTSVRFRAHEVDLGKLPLHEVSATATIDHGVLKVAPLVAEVLGGRATAYLTLDATREVPAAHVDLKIADLALGQLARKDPGHPPMEGPMQASLQIVGQGSSLHAVAASADGTLRVQVAHGAIRESLAELTGIDLRGLGLLLSKDKQDIPVNCAVGTLAAHGGSLTVQNLLADTDSVLITGQGQIHLDTENLDLQIRGQPKELRLFRLRAPVAVRGTLLHPSIGIDAHKSSLVIVDPGRARNADCATLLAQFSAGETHVPSH